MTPAATNTLSSLEGVLDALGSEVEGEDKLSVDDVLGAFGTRAFGPLLVAPSVVALSPLGAVPGVPTAIGCLIVLVAGQHAIGLDSPWVPKALRERSVSTDDWDDARDTLTPWAKRIDRLIKPRLTVLTKGVADRVLAVVACVAAMLMVPLELVPFAVMIPGTAVLLLGLAILTRDGVAAGLGACVTATAAWIAVSTVA